MEEGHGGYVWRSCSSFLKVRINVKGTVLSDSAFRYRGLKVVIDTTEKAEFDIKGYQISDARLERIGRRLRESALFRADRIIGDIRIRRLEGYDVVFIVGRESDTLVITIGAVEVPDPNNPIEVILQKLGYIAIFRGASGL